MGDSSSSSSSSGKGKSLGSKYSEPDRKDWAKANNVGMYADWTPGVSNKAVGLTHTPSQLDAAFSAHSVGAPFGGFCSPGASETGDRYGDLARSIAKTDVERSFRNLTEVSEGRHAAEMGKAHQDYQANYGSSGLSEGSWWDDFSVVETTTVSQDASPAQVEAAREIISQEEFAGEWWDDFTTTIGPSSNVAAPNIDEPDQIDAALSPIESEALPTGKAIQYGASATGVATGVIHDASGTFKNVGIVTKAAGRLATGANVAVDAWHVGELAMAGKGREAFVEGVKATANNVVSWGSQAGGAFLGGLAGGFFSAGALSVPGSITGRALGYAAAEGLKSTGFYSDALDWAANGLADLASDAFGLGWPVVIDIDSDGIELTSLYESSTFKDLDNDDYLENTGWVSADDGLLVIDLNEDGIVDQAEELVLTEWADEANTDLEALQIAFDTNDDLVFDAHDERWNEFRVWQDLDQDGEVDEGELHTLDDLGIVSIDLDLTSIEEAEVWTDLDGDGVMDDDELSGELASPDAPVIENRDGNVIYRSAAIEWEDGSTGKAYDTAFAYNPNGIKKDETDGRIEIEFEDGSMAIQYEGTDDITLDLGESGYTTAFGAEGNDDFSTTGEDSVVIDAGAGDDSVIGGEGDDLLSGGEGSDTLHGGAGHDVLVIDADDLPENIDGGEGFDVAHVSGEESVTIDLNATNLETIYGNEGDDTLFTSGDGDVLIQGGGGDDSISGGAGNDMLAGGEGSDTISAGAGDDIVFIDAEDDLANIDGGEGYDAVYISDDDGVTIDLADNNFEEGHGGSGDDHIFTSSDESVLITGGDGNDTLTGTDQADTLSGGAGNDVIEGQAGADYLYGEDGDDSITAGDGNDILNGGAGNDTLDGGSGEDLYVFGHGSGQDTVVDASGDFVYLTQDVTREDLNFTRSGSDLILKINGTDDSLTMEGWFDGNKANGFVLSGTDPDNPDYVYVMSEDDDRYRLDNDRNWNIVTLGGEDNIQGTWQNWSWNGEWQATDESMTRGFYADLGGGNDEVVGGDGNDTFQGGAGADTLEGKGGSDTAVYSSSDAGVTVDLAAGTAEGGHAQGDKLTSIENVTGSEHDDQLTGTGGSNTLSGRSGDDVLNGQAGNDELIGGAGADTLKGGDGQDTASYKLSEFGVEVDLTAGTGTGGDAEGDVLEDIENLTGSDQHDKLTGDDNDNVLKGEAGHDVLSGGAGDDQLYGGTGDDILDGEEGDDHLLGEAGVDLLSGGAGNDTLDGGAGHDILLGGEGDDIVDGGVGSDRMDGGEGADTLLGGAGDDTMDGGAGDDLLQAGEGDDKLEGGEGADTLEAGAGDDELLGGDGDDILRGEAGNDSLDGGAGNDTIEGGVGVDTIDGGAGDDFIDTGIGHTGDQVTGGEGNDTVSYESSREGVRIDLGAGTADYGQAIGDTLEGVESIIGSETGDDQLTGSDEDNLLDGRGGDDLIQGGAGADTLIGGEGSDTLSYADSSAGVTIDLSTGEASGGTAEGDEISGFEAVVGSDHGDDITGSDGDDTIDSGAGDDTLSGGIGADVLDGGEGVDLADYSGSDAGVSIDLTDGTGAGGDAEGDTLRNIEDLTGSDHADTLLGSAQDNTIDSGQGDDMVAGLAGDDTLSGGAGEDMLSGGYGDDSVTLGAGDDFVMTGDGDDTIVMGDGDDMVVGGAGTDTAVFDGPAGDYVIETINGTTFVRSAGGETDVLREVEILRFDDREISVADTVAVAPAAAKKKDEEEDALARPRMTAAEMISMAAALGVAAVATTKESSAYDLGLLPSDDGVPGAGDESGVLAADEGGGPDLVLAPGDEAVDGAVVDVSAGSGAVDDPEIPGGVASGTSKPGAPEVASVVTGEEFAPEASGVNAEGSGGEVTVATDETTTTVTVSSDTDDDDDSDDDSTEETVLTDFVVSLSADDVSGDEDSGIQLDIGAAMKFDVFNEALSVEITGLPSGAVLSHGTEIEPGVWQVEASELGLLTITPPSDDATDFSLTVSTSGSGWGDYSALSGSATRTFEVEVKAVADAPTMTVTETTTATSASSSGDTLNGTAGDDTISAGGGDDTIDGGAGADIIYGDTTDETSATASLDISAALTDLDGSESLSVTIFNVPTGGSLSAGTEVEPGIWLLSEGDLTGLEITVPAGADDYEIDVVATSVETDPDTGEQVTATTGPLTITVEASDSTGNDVIDGGAGNDTLFGEAGNDVLTGGEGADELYGGSGNDTLYFDGEDVIDGGDDFDTVEVTTTDGVDIDLGAINVEKVVGNSGDDRFYTSGTDAVDIDAGAGDDVLIGGDGDDTLVGGSGSDAITAGAGNDTIIVDSDDNMAFIDGGSGDDTLTVDGTGGVSIDVGTAHVETAIGGSGDDEFLNTGADATDVDGGDGDDVIHSGEGADTLTGGSGSDTLNYSTSTAGVNVNLATGSVSGGFAAGDVISGFEHVVGSGNDDNIGGDSGDNILDGGDGYDTAVYSGDSSDFTIVRTSSGVTVEDGTGAEGTDTLTGFEALQFGDTAFDIADFELDGNVAAITGEAISGVFGGQNESLTYTIEDGPEHGSLTVNEDGSYTYTAIAGYTGTDTFTYRAVDENGIINIGEMSVDVNPSGELVNRGYGNAALVALAPLPDGGYVVARQLFAMNETSVSLVRYDEAGQVVGSYSASNAHSFTPSVAVLTDGTIAFSYCVVGHYSVSNGSEGPTHYTTYANMVVFLDESLNLRASVVDSYPTNDTSCGVLKLYATNDGRVGVISERTTRWYQDGGDSGAGTWYANSETHDRIYSVGAGLTAGGLISTNPNHAAWYANSGRYVLPEYKQNYSLQDGEYYTTRASYNNISGQYTYYLQRYDATSSPIGEEIELHSAADSRYRSFETLVLADGRILTVWIDPHSHPNTGSVGGTILDFTSGEVQGADGNDALAGGHYDDAIIAGAGDDALYGNAGDDTLRGEGDNDVLVGGTGDDYLDGGDGTDVAMFDGDYDDFIVTKTGDNTGTIEWNGAAGTDLGTDTVINVEQLQFNDRTIYLDGTNNRPDAVDDTGSGVEDTTQTINAATLLANDSDFDGDVFSLTAVGDATNCTVAIDADGNVTFTPDAGFVGDATFIYTIEDDGGESHQATVTVAVAASGAPVVLDLDGDGLEFTTLAESNVVMDVDGDGVLDRVAWVGADDGFLAFDRNGDGTVNGFSEISFVDDHPDARTDLEGLALAFDSNDDGVFDAADAKWSSFGVWQDANSDGVCQSGEYASLDSVGIASINLVSDWQAERMDDVWLHGRSSYAFEDGTQRELGDVGLTYEEADTGSDDMITFGDQMTAEDQWLTAQATPVHDAAVAEPIHFDAADNTSTGDIAGMDDLPNSNEIVEAMAVFSADAEPVDLNIGLEDMGACDVLWDAIDVEDITVDR